MLQTHLDGKSGLYRLRQSVRGIDSEASWVLVIWMKKFPWAIRAVYKVEALCKKVFNKRDVKWKVVGAVLVGYESIRGFGIGSILEMQNFATWLPTCRALDYEAACMNGNVLVSHVRVSAVHNFRYIPEHTLAYILRTGLHNFKK